MGPLRWRVVSVRLSILAFSLALSGCELNEVTLAEPQDIPVVEAYIMIGDGEDQVSAFLHWTLGTRPARDLMDLEALLTKEDGVQVPLFPGPLSGCVLPGLVEEVEGVCYTASVDVEGFFPAGTRVELEILFDDQLLRGATEIPEDIDLIQPSVGNRCVLPAGENLEIIWNRSPGVWAYSAEAEIEGLREALALEGVSVEADSVALIGLAISDSDTTMVFPREFGVFERFDLEQDIAVALQEGLPRGAFAEVVLGALDQNYVNWVRGGNFNPSGTVRVSTFRGPAIGVFGSVVRRTLSVLGGGPGYLPGSVIPNCLPDPGP